jgi:hypothetical protein
MNINLAKLNDFGQIWLNLEFLKLNLTNNFWNWINLAKCDTQKKLNWLSI